MKFFSVFLLLVVVNCEYPNDLSVVNFLRDILLHQKSEVIEKEIHNDFRFKTCEGTNQSRSDFISNILPMTDVANNLNNADIYFLGGSKFKVEVELNDKIFGFEIIMEGDRITLEKGFCDPNKIQHRRMMDDAAYVLPTDELENKNNSN